VLILIPTSLLHIIWRTSCACLSRDRSTKLTFVKCSPSAVIATAANIFAESDGLLSYCGLQGTGEPLYRPQYKFAASLLITCTQSSANIALELMVVLIVLNWKESKGRKRSRMTHVTAKLATCHPASCTPLKPWGKSPPLNLIWNFLFSNVANPQDGRRVCCEASENGSYSHRYSQWPLPRRRGTFRLIVARSLLTHPGPGSVHAAYAARLCSLDSSPYS
jgi:hypothetical protein